MELQKDNDRLRREIDRLRWEVSRPDDELATKWDVATIVIVLVGGLVAAVAAILGVARWITG